MWPFQSPVGQRFGLPDPDDFTRGTVSFTTGTNYHGTTKSPAPPLTTPRVGPGPSGPDDAVPVGTPVRPGHVPYASPLGRRHGGTRRPAAVVVTPLGDGSRPRDPGFPPLTLSHSSYKHPPI